ncbi:uncharacterized protein J3D65DRAFT_358924 [Phyllosticta citribraziliensis]|uniref:Uncharacterized protein n=1 Tax=Phyllosticta citribraziliensis TaxID=989973 RepID=A0ABR1LP35_9PEZI
MKFGTSLASLFLVLLASGPAPTAATRTKIINMCKFDIYAKTTMGGGYDSGGKHKIKANGGTYDAPISPKKNSPDGGLCIKLQHDEEGSFDSDIYQIEVSETDGPMGMNSGDGEGGHLWYDMSTVNGKPWRERWRRLELEGPRGCPVLECAPHHEDCEWPTPESTGKMGDCKGGEEVTVLFTLCRGNGLIGINR